MLKNNFAMIFVFSYGKIYEMQSIKIHFFYITRTSMHNNHAKSDWYSQIKKNTRFKFMAFWHVAFGHQNPRTLKKMHALLSYLVCE